MELSPREQVRPPSNTIATLATTAGSLTHAVSSAHPSRAEPAPSSNGLGRSPPLLSSNIHGLHPATTLPCTAPTALATATFALARLDHCLNPLSTRTAVHTGPGLRGPIAGNAVLNSACNTWPYVRSTSCPSTLSARSPSLPARARGLRPPGSPSLPARGSRASHSAYAVTSPARLPGPTLAQLLASARRPPGRRPYRHGPAEPCDGLRSQALSRPPPGPMLALLLIFHAVCPVAVITGTGLLAHNGSRSRELRPLPEPTPRPTTATSRSLPGRRPYRHGPASQDGITVESPGTPAWLLALLDLLPKARSLPRSPSLPARACAASQCRLGPDAPRLGHYPEPSPSLSMVSNRHDVRFIPPK